MSAVLLVGFRVISFTPAQAEEDSHYFLREPSVVRLPASDEPAPAVAPAKPVVAAVSPAPAVIPAEPVKRDDGSWFQPRGQDIGFSYLYMTGAPAEALGASGMGRALGVEIGTYRGGSWFDLMGKVRFSRASGTTLLPDLTSPVDFSLVSGEAIMGMRMHLLPGEFHWGAPYIGAAGILGLQFLKLSHVPATADTVYPASSSLAMGTQFFTGVRFTQRAFAEIQLRSMTSGLANVTSLSVTGLGLVFGIVW